MSVNIITGDFPVDLQDFAQRIVQRHRDNGDVRPVDFFSAEASAFALTDLAALTGAIVFVEASVLRLLGRDYMRARECTDLLTATRQKSLTLYVLTSDPASLDVNVRHCSRFVWLVRPFCGFTQRLGLPAFYSARMMTAPSFFGSFRDKACPATVVRTMIFKGPAVKGDALCPSM